jgi:hypothetical protein
MRHYSAAVGGRSKGGAHAGESRKRKNFRVAWGPAYEKRGISPVHRAFGPAPQGKDYMPANAGDVDGLAPSGPLACGVASPPRFSGAPCDSIRSRFRGSSPSASLSSIAAPPRCTLLGAHLRGRAGLQRSARACGGFRYPHSIRGLAGLQRTRPTAEPEVPRREGEALSQHPRTELL